MHSSVLEEVILSCPLSWYKPADTDLPKKTTAATPVPTPSSRKKEPSNKVNAENIVFSATTDEVGEKKVQEVSNKEEQTKFALVATLKGGSRSEQSITSTSDPLELIRAW